MFGTADVVARTLPVYGAFSPWWVLIWLALMAGCLVSIAGVVALVKYVAAAHCGRSQVRRRVRIAPSIDGTSNP